MTGYCFRIAVTSALLLTAIRNSAESQVLGVTTTLSGMGLTPNACSSSGTHGTLISSAVADWALARVAWSGAVTSTLRGGSEQNSTLRALVTSPEWHGWRVDANAQRDIGQSPCGESSALRVYGTGVSYSWQRSGVSLRYTRRLTRQASSVGADTLSQRVLGPTTRGVALSAWQNLGSAVLSLSVGSQSQWREERRRTVRQVSGIDTIPSDSGPLIIPRSGYVTDTKVQRGLLHDFGSEIRFGWSRGPMTLDALAGRALGARRTLEGRSWGRVDGSFSVTPSLAIVGGYVVDDGLDTRRTMPRRYFTLGARLTSTPFDRGDDIKKPARAIAAAWLVQASPDGLVTLGIRSANARLVEVTGDFVQWRPVRMHRVSTDWWELRMPMSRGLHRVNVRVDGGEWSAPPGLPLQRDEFGGDAGVFVIS